MDKYMDLVLQTARKLGKEFFLDCGEGRDWESPDHEWCVEDLSGWLVDLKEYDEFASMWKQGGRQAIWDSRRWGSAHYFVKWALVNGPFRNGYPVVVRFEKSIGYE